MQGIATPEILTYPGGTAFKQLVPNSTKPASHDKQVELDEQLTQFIVKAEHNLHSAFILSG